MHDGLIGLGAYRSGEAVLTFSKDLVSFLQPAQIPVGGNLKRMEPSGRQVSGRCCIAAGFHSLGGGTVNIRLSFYLHHCAGDLRVTSAWHTCRGAPGNHKSMYS